MYYCFVQEDLEHLLDDDQLVIQAEYAKSLGLFYLCQLNEEIITDQNKSIVYVYGKRIFLRATCTTLPSAMSLLIAQGAELLETASDIQAVEQWDQLLLAKRKIFSLSVEELLFQTLPQSMIAFLQETPTVFIKSRKKGYSALVSSKRILELDSEIVAFFGDRRRNFENELMLSEALHFKTDSLGQRESRHFVFDGNISNSSRTLHSIRHSVPRSMIDHATYLVELISKIKKFPRNYVIDIGEYLFDGQSTVDIIELNPVSCSLCYMNNSIFQVEPSPNDAYQSGMGVEYRYDAISHPKRYFDQRLSQVSYGYICDERYCFQ